MGREYQCTYLIGSRDSDGQELCRPSALLGFLQETAIAAAADFGFSREVARETYNCLWMVARAWYELRRPLVWGDELTVRTWHRGASAAMLYRDFELYSGGEQIGQAINVWALADVDTRKLTRLSGVQELQDTHGGALRCDKMLHKLSAPDDLKLAHARVMRYSDIDRNGHVNNTKYADMLCDAVELERIGTGHYISQLQIGYLAECRPGDVLNVYTGVQDGKWYACGSDAAGKARFEGAIDLFPLPEGILRR